MSWRRALVAAVLLFALTASCNSKSKSALARDCRGHDLEIAGVNGDALVNQHAEIVYLKNTSNSTCAFAGYPTSLTGTRADGKRSGVIAITHLVQKSAVLMPGNVKAGSIGVVVFAPISGCPDPNGVAPAAPSHLSLQLFVPGGGAVDLDPFAPDVRCGLSVSQLGIAGPTVTTTTAVTVPDTEAAATTTTSVVLATPCTAADLGIDQISGGGAGGTEVLDIEFRNTSSQSCSLAGFPTFVTGRTNAGAALTVSRRDEVLGVPPPPGNLEAGSAGGILEFGTNEGCEAAAHPFSAFYRHVVVGFPGGGSLSLGDVVIDGTCGVTVGRFGVRT
jgi:hypothetical protein